MLYRTYALSVEALKNSSMIVELRELVTGRFAISYTAFIFSRFGIFFSISAERNLGHPAKVAILFTAIAEVIRLLILVIADKTYLSKRVEFPAKLRIVLLTWFISAFAGSIFGGLALELSSEYSGHFWLRVLPNGIFTFIGFMIATIITSQIHQDRQDINFLRGRVDVARENQEIAFRKVILEQREQEVLARIEIARGLEKLQSQLEIVSPQVNVQDLNKLIAAFDSYSTNVVRKVSQNLRSMVNRGQDGKEVKTGFFETVRYFTKLNQFNVAPLISLAAVFFIGSAIQFPQNGINGVFFILWLCAGIAPILFFLYIINERFVSQKWASRYFSILVAIAAIYLTSQLISDSAEDYIDLRFPSALEVTPFRTTIAVVFISIARTFQKRKQIYSKQIEDALLDSESNISFLQSESDRVRLELADFLHGSVQGKLASISMSLKLYLQESKDRTPKDNEVLIERAKNMIMQILDEVNQKDLFGRQETEIVNYLEELKVQYGALVEISHRVTSSALVVLEKNEGTKESVIEVISNAVTNAVRHGQSRNIAISISTPNSKSVKIEVVDDGIGLPTIVKQGHGVRRIAKLSDSWELANGERGGGQMIATILVKP